MKWPSLFGREPPPPAPTAPPPTPPAQAAAPAERRFLVDRGRMFDLAQTGALDTLFKVPAASRDARWREAFFGAVWNASLEVGTPNVFKGPDGFGYLRLHLPAPATAFDSNSLANFAATCVARATGAAIFASPTATTPEYVLSMGLLDCLLRYDSWEGDPQDVQEMRTVAPEARAGGLRAETVAQAREVLLGTPSADYLPPATARALHRHLTEGWKLADPRVRLMADPQIRPTRSLIINRRLSEFPDRDHAAAQCEALTWYLPPLRSLALLPDGWSEDEMTPLAELARLGE